MTARSDWTAQVVSMFTDSLSAGVKLRKSFEAKDHAHGLASGFVVLVPNAMAGWLYNDSCDACI